MEGESPAGSQGVNNEATHRCMYASTWDTCAKGPLMRNKGKFLEPQDLPHPFLLQEGDPFQGPKLGSCLTLRNELPKETHVLTKSETLSARGAQGESWRVREPRRAALFYGDGISFRVVFSQSF